MAACKSTRVGLWPHLAATTYLVVVVALSSKWCVQHASGREIHPHYKASTTRELDALHEPWAAAATTRADRRLQGDLTLDFPIFANASTDLILGGNATIVAGKLELNAEDTFVTGLALYRQPVLMTESANGTCRPRSFNSTFSFVIGTAEPGWTGDGMSFVVVPESTFFNETVGERLGYCFNDPSTVSAGSFAVEFDTFLSVSFSDTNGNHVGVDFNRSCKSLATAPASTTLADGQTKYVWLDMDGPAKELRVYIATTNTKPADVAVRSPLDLCALVGPVESRYVGFAGTTGLAIETHTVLAWTFQSFLELPLPATPPPAPPPPPPLSPAPQPPPPPAPDSSTSKSSSTIIIVASIVGVLVALCLVLGLAYFCWRRKADPTVRAAHQKLGASGSLQRRDQKDFISSVEGSYVRPLPLSEILKATDNFTTKVLGEGGFGVVYLGAGPDGTPWAVKRAKNVSAGGLEELKNEVRVISHMSHGNILPLRGYCLEEEEQILVYEYMENKNLKYQLHNADNHLSFQQRLDIALGAAKGLEYLHHHAKPTIIHRDIKTDNILLDKNMQARVADFGLLRKDELGAASGIATRVAGTPGYVDPEYFQTNRVTYKSDVYSFGVVLLELISGKQAVVQAASNDPDEMYSSINLVSYVQRLQGNLDDIVDPRLQGEYLEAAMREMLKLALRCTSRRGKVRPSMEEVASSLYHIKASLAGPQEPDNAEPEGSDEDEGHEVDMGSLVASGTASGSSFFQAPMSKQAFDMR